VLRPVRKPITTLNCVLLKDNNRALVARLGPEINSRSYLCVLKGPRHNTQCWFSIQCFIFLLMFCLQTPKKASVSVNLWTEPSLASSSVISLPRTPACPGTQYSPTVCRVEMSFNAFWDCRDVYVKKSCSNYSKNTIRHLSKVLSTGRPGARDLDTSVTVDARTCEAGWTLLDREMRHWSRSSKNVQHFWRQLRQSSSEFQCDSDNKCTLVHRVC
jgi:hypothetical protein